MKFETLFRCRKQCMTAAIVLILLNHMKAAWPESPMKIAASFFYGGVDLFFFLSGVGCFFSWRRDRDPAAFLRRRALRILPSYLPFILVWLALQAAKSGITPAAVLVNLLGVQGFVKIEPAFNWYVSALWLSYLLTPWLAALAERCDTKTRAAAASALERFRAGRALNRAAGFVGGYTFEIYLTHFLLPQLPAPIFLLCTALCTALLAAVSKLLRRTVEKRRTAEAAL